MTQLVITALAVAGAVLPIWAIALVYRAVTRRLDILNPLAEDYSAAVEADSAEQRESSPGVLVQHRTQAVRERIRAAGVGTRYADQNEILLMVERRVLQETRPSLKLPFVLVVLGALSSLAATMLDTWQP